MSEVTAVPRFACEGCGKSYKWKPELSHKRVKCPCGATMTVPDLTPRPDDAPPALPEDDIFALIDNAPAIAPPLAAKAIAQLSAAPVAPAKGKSPAGGRPGAPVGYQGRPTPARPRRDSFETFYDMKRDVYLPTALIAGSALAYLAWLLLAGKATAGGSLAVYAIAMFVVLAVKTVLMIGGAFIVAPMAGVSFGPFWTAILKLAAVTVTTDVAVTVVDGMIGMAGGMIVANSIGLAIYWGLIALLFDLDAAEAWWVVVLFGVLRWVLNFVVMMIALSVFFGGAGRGALSGVMDDDAGAAIAATSEAAEFDQTVADLKENELLEEGLAYIKRTGRQGGKQETINRLYDAGAKNISFTLAKDINGKTEPLSLAVEWPRDAKKRAAVLAEINASMKREAAARAKASGDPDDAGHVPTPMVDTGGKYIELPIGN